MRGHKIAKNASYFLSMSPLRSYRPTNDQVGRRSPPSFNVIRILERHIRGRCTHRPHIRGLWITNFVPGNDSEGVICPGRQANFKWSISRGYNICRKKEKVRQQKPFDIYFSGHTSTLQIFGDKLHRFWLFDKYHHK